MKSNAKPTKGDLMSIVIAGLIAISAGILLAQLLCYSTYKGQN